MEEKWRKKYENGGKMEEMKKSAQILNLTPCNRHYTF